jgi:hypothetical protein
MLVFIPDIGDHKIFCITGWGAAAQAAIESAIEDERLPALQRLQEYSEEDKPLSGCSYYFQRGPKGEGLELARHWLEGDIVRGQYTVMK